MTTDHLTSAFTRFRERLRSVAAGIVGTDEADDVIHDAFCRLWSGHREVGTEVEALKLSYTAVRNSAIDTLRRAGTHPTVPFAPPLHMGKGKFTLLCIAQGIKRL